MKYLFLLVFLATPYLFFAQTLESQMRTDGVVFPRVSTVERDINIPSPIEGQCIYNTDRGKIECYDGDGWERTSFYSLSGSAFHPDNDDNNTQWIAGENGANFQTAPLAFRGMVAGVNLPHNCKVVNITIFYEDLDANNSCNFNLKHNNSLMANISNTDFSTNSLNTVGGMPGIISIDTDITIDNSDKAYQFTMRPNVANTLNANFRLFKVTFEYVEDAGDPPMPPSSNNTEVENRMKIDPLDAPTPHARLYDNHPNPFTESTILRYFIPENVHQAEFHIINTSGEALKIIPINDKGEGQTILKANTLRAGNYFYSLVLDGQVLATKQLLLLE